MEQISAPYCYAFCRRKVADNSFCSTLQRASLRIPVSENGKYSGFRFYLSLCRCRIGMWIVMNVLLIAPELKYNIDTPPLPIGLFSIATEIKKNNYNVNVFDRTIHKDSLEAIYDRYAPDIVGVSIISTHVLKDAIKVSLFFHAKKVPVIWGGIFPSQMPEVFLKNDYIDMISIGEGEKTFVELLNAIQNKTPLHDIKGLAYKSGNTIIVNPEREFLKPEEIPRIDYSLITVSDYVTNYGKEFGEKVLWLSTARGCPFNCAFCYNHAFNHSKVRRRNPSDWTSEISMLLQNNSIDAVFFADEVWCFSSGDMRNRCDEIRRTGMKFNWGCFVNAGILTKEDYQYMYDSGCRLIYIGLESGSEEILRKVRKPINVESAFCEIKNCAEIGINSFVSFIIGFPDETAEQLKLTADLMKRVSYYGKLFCYFYLPYAGSDLYEELLDRNKVRQITDISNFNTKFPFSTLTNTDDRNFSNVSLKELNLIYSYSLMWSFFNKKEHNEKSFSGALMKGTKDFFASVSIRRMNFSGFVNVSYFLYTYGIALLRVCFHRKTAKKYNLTIK